MVLYIYIYMLYTFIVMVLNGTHLPSISNNSPTPLNDSVSYINLQKMKRNTKLITVQTVPCTSVAAQPHCLAIQRVVPWIKKFNIKYNNDVLPKENVVDLLSYECSQSEKLAVYSMQHSFKKISFPWILAVKQLQQLQKTIQYVVLQTK